MKRASRAGWRGCGYSHVVPLVYLETSFVSACVTDRTDAASTFRRQTSIEWWNTQRVRHDLFLSAEVIAELSGPGFKQSAKALALVREVPLLALTEEVRGLARVLIREKVVPGPLAGDALHVAAACWHAMDYVVSWNVRHLANPNKLIHLRAICLRLELIPPRIVTPDLLWEELQE
jgi:hypothetical protein